MNAWIDDLRLIRIETSQPINHIQLNDLTLTWLKTENGSQFFQTDHDIVIHQTDFMMVNHQQIPLHIGLVTLSELFNQKYQYDGPLGVHYTKSYTDFYLFTPVARDVLLVVDGKTYETSYRDGVRHVRVNGDLEGQTYFYRVRLQEIWHDVKDPYAHAQGLLGNYIIDWEKTTLIDPSPIKLQHHVDAVIYEGHVRDMTVDLDVKNKGTFNGLLEQSKQLGMRVIDYVKSLGMTHLQLLPVYDFEHVNEINKSERYNWGYNPSQYFSLEGWYAVNPKDPYDRINAFKTLINEAHNIGLGINMDVVYNHVYNHETFPYDYLVPGYFYRHDKHHEMTNSSYCGNDLETRHYMVRRLIKDSLMHWVKNFQIDGFRFDLMGLIDIQTMKEIEVALKAIHPSIMLYGEGWNMQTAMKPEECANQLNQHQLHAYAQFNDFFRNTLKGELNTAQRGYTMGNQHLIEQAMKALTGSPHMFDSPNQSINYVECHDNLTYYDAAMLKHIDENKRFIYADLAMHMITISQGVPFYHAGQEFYRTKQGVENSFESPDDINHIKWKSQQENVKQLKKLLDIRKTYDLYRQTSYQDCLVQTKVVNQTIIYELENDQEKLIHYIKNDFNDETLSLVEGKLIFSSTHVQLNDQNINVKQPGIFIIYVKK